jgi:amphi-Trp domain-containing protein
MSEQTIHQAKGSRSRRRIGAYLHRVAEAFESGDPVPVEEDDSVTVDPPEESTMEVEVEREDGMLSLEIEVEWPEPEGGVDTDLDAGSAATFELYRDNADEWRWRLRHDNGNIIADSGEGYTTKENAVNGFESVRRNAPGAVVEELD